MVKEKAQSVEELEQNSVSVIRTIAVREKAYWNEGICFRSAWDAAEFAKPLFENADKEYLLVCCLDGKLQPISMEVVAVGMVNQCLVGMREVFKNAILSNAVSIIVFHNHPSGDCRPSSSDFQISKKLRQAGELLDIEVLDHIVLGDEEFHSIANTLEWESWKDTKSKIA